MQRDMRETALYQEAETWCRLLRQPGTGQISDAAEIRVSPDCRQAVFAGTILDTLEGAPPTRICSADLISGMTRVLTFGPNIDRMPKYAPDGRQIAFLSDRHKRGDFQLYLLDPVSGAARSTPRVDGWVEYLHWSPDGTRILLGVAGHGADVSGGQGAITSNRLTENSPSWMPAVDAGDETYRWRRAWVYALATNTVRQVSNAESNLWEATWCGNGALAAVVSPGPGEGLWYSAHVQIIDIDNGRSRQLYTPHAQLGWPAASPSGRHLAIVEAICSDRWVVAGDLRLIDTHSAAVRKIDTDGVDITYTEWRSDRRLLLAGHRGFEAVTGVYDVDSGTFTQAWASRDITANARYITPSFFNEMGDCVFVGESFSRAPEIGMVRQGQYRAIRSFDLGGYSDRFNALATVECIRWKAPDGLEIQGWLLCPKQSKPHPLVMNVHGGPVWHWRPRWLARSGLSELMLLQKGYAIFLPNPRGSSGRGQDFTRHVLGDMGGADTHDYLSGLDYLVNRGLADPKRLGVTGGSYGGFMTSWLITQDSRFAAAVSISPHTNQVSQHLVSNIPHFMPLLLADKYNNPGGKYFQRSPIMHTDKAGTPTLNICGALDRCTPPEEAVQFHNALLESGVRSVLVTYPEEGHGVRKLPAAIDYAARITSWFTQHMPAEVNA